MTRSIQQAREVAELARLELSDEELERYAEQLSAILTYVAQLDELDTHDVEGTTHVDPELCCPLRADQPQPSTKRETLMGQAPQQEAGFFQVPQVSKNLGSSRE